MTMSAGDAAGVQKNTAYGVFVQACWAQHKRQYPDELIHKEIEEFNKQGWNFLVWGLVKLIGFHQLFVVGLFLFDADCKQIGRRLNIVNSNYFCTTLLAIQN